MIVHTLIAGSRPYFCRPEIVRVLALHCPRDLAFSPGAGLSITNQYSADTCRMKISVALCTWNGERFLRPQLDSILSQRIPIDELIVCDDRSSDRTADILKDYADNYPEIVRLHFNEVNVGGKKNFEHALSMCSGNIILFSDQDDVWVPEKTAVVAQHFLENPVALGVFSNAALVNDTGVETGEKFWESILFSAQNQACYNRENLIEYLLEYSNLVAGSMLAIRREAVPMVMPFQLQEFMWHDEWIALNLAARKRLDYIRTPLIQYRIHASQQIGVTGSGDPASGLAYLASIKDEGRMKNDLQLRFNHYWQVYWRVLRNSKAIPELKKHAALYREHALEAKRTLLAGLPFPQRKARQLKWLLEGKFEATFSELIGL